MKQNCRAISALIINDVIENQKSLLEILPQYQDLPSYDQNKALIHEIVYGSLRYYLELQTQINTFLKQKIKKKQRGALYLLVSALYQLKYMRTPTHAVLFESVEACKQLKLVNLSGMVNAILRNIIKQLPQLKQNQLSDDNALYSHPTWLIKKIKQHYPQDWQAILIANNKKPPLWLRNNQQKQKMEDYQTILEEHNIEYITAVSPNALLIPAIPIHKIPYFFEGRVSIQDTHAQIAAQLLNPQKDDVILDACAAPGGKTCHILELCPNIKTLTALDVNASRIKKIEENLTRLQLSAQLVVGDARYPEKWNNNTLYSKILLDVPCSGTGVIRRHPDGKWIKSDNDLYYLLPLQYQILQSCWSLLQTGGTLLYSTCSILKEENEQQIEKFLQNNDDALHIPIDDKKKQQIGMQLLPKNEGGDGFYYAKIMKKTLSEKT